MSPTFAVNGKDSGTARILGSGTSGMYSVPNFVGRSENRARANQSPRSLIVGVAELLIFHPVDTIAKRLMSYKAKVSTFVLFVQTSMT